MTGRKYILWFGSVVVALFLAAIGFNIAAERYILSHPAFGSVQLMSGFERVLKPAWLDSVKPQWVFAGSSRMRVGFDPVLVDPRFRVKSFNYGVSSVTAYETRRFVQDAAAQASVKKIFVALDSFTSGSEAQSIASGFDEYRLAVTPHGSPTPYRQFWLTMARYVSGGALGMHALSVQMLAQLKDGQPASERPDVFSPYAPMDYAYFRRDLERRKHRTIGLTTYQRGELHNAMDAICRKDIQLILFFPPDNFALMAHYIENDLAAFVGFKAAVREELAAYRQRCGDNIRVVDYMTFNRLTDDRITERHASAIHVDLVHFLPRTGITLLNDMIGPKSAPEIGREISPAKGESGQAVRDVIRKELLRDLALWRSGN